MKIKTPKALQDVWDMKDRAYKSVEHLPLEMAITKRLEDSIKLGDDYKRNKEADAQKKSA